jgi:hypothetical protein
VVTAHGEVYAAEFGWDSSFEALVARIVADYAADRDHSREAAWIAEVDGHRVGCVFCVRGDPEGVTAKLRILLTYIRGFWLCLRHADRTTHGRSGRDCSTRRGSCCRTGTAGGSPAAQVIFPWRALP